MAVMFEMENWSAALAAPAAARRLCDLPFLQHKIGWVLPASEATRYLGAALQLRWNRLFKLRLRCILQS